MWEGVFRLSTTENQKHNGWQQTCYKAFNSRFVSLNTKYTNDYSLFWKSSELITFNILLCNRLYYMDISILFYVWPNFNFKKLHPKNCGDFI